MMPAAADVSLPSPPPSAFFLFAAKHKIKVAAEHPNLDAREVTKKVGAAWLKLDPEDKAPYEKEAADKRLKYENLLTQRQDSSSAGKSSPTKGRGHPKGKEKRQ